jgi:sec-independent protein translocase protein TatA
MLTAISANSVCLAFFSPGPMEMVIIGVIAVLLFGSRLPDVARSMGKSLVEFKKGMRGIEDEVHSTTSSVTSSTYYDPDDHQEASAPKFQPPASEPQAEESKAEA